MDNKRLVLIGIIVLVSFYVFVYDKSDSDTFSLVLEEKVITENNKTRKTLVVEEIRTEGGKQIVKLGQPPTEKGDIAGLCGNGICEEEIGETPVKCFSDCKQKVWDLDSIFCMPFLNCGNWKTAWFSNSLIILLIIALLSHQFRIRKVKRKI